MNTQPEFYTSLKRQVKALSKEAPAVMKGFGQLHKAAQAEGELSTKTKELIALSIAVAVRCDACITYHLVDALKAGASRAEITEAVGVSVLMGGGPAMMYGAQALETLNQLEAQPKVW